MYVCGFASPCMFLHTIYITNIHVSNIYIPFSKYYRHMSPHIVHRCMRLVSICNNIYTYLFIYVPQLYVYTIFLTIHMCVRFASALYVTLYNNVEVCITVKCCNSQHTIYIYIANIYASNIYMILHFYVNSVPLFSVRGLLYLSMIISNLKGSTHIYI